MNSENKKQVCGLIGDSSSPLILIPENFDIDALSGALGLFLSLKSNGKDPHIACSSVIPEKLLFLAEKIAIEKSIQEEHLCRISFRIGEGRIKSLSYTEEGGVFKIDLVAAGNDLEFEKPGIKLFRSGYDLIFVIGSPDLGSLGKIYRDNIGFFSRTAIINIDHHKENKNFGFVNLVEPSLSVSESIAEIASLISDNAVSDRIAYLFLTGVIAKTNNFQLEKIRPETFVLASDLIRAGADRDAIIGRLVSLDFLAVEKIEFYPASKITKQIIDKISRKSDWYLLQEKGKVKRIDGLKLLVLNQQFFYLVAALGVIPALMLLERANPRLKSILKNAEVVVLEKNLIRIGEDKFLTDMQFFLTKDEGNQAMLRKPEQGLPENKTSDDPRPKIATVELPEAAKEVQNPKNPDKTGKNVIIEDKKEKIGLPKKFSMPAFGINTRVQEVGFSSSGEMKTPSDAQSVGWFKLGVKPGEKGNAVVAGHLDSVLGEQGVFWDLSKMKAGDYVYVTDEYGKRMRFRVMKSEVYDTENAPMEEIFGPSDKARLNLITCNGTWDSGKRSYNKRLVVFTDYDPE